MSSEDYNQARLFLEDSAENLHPTRAIAEALAGIGYAILALVEAVEEAALVEDEDTPA